MAIRFHPHALERMKERCTTEYEVEATIEYGEQFPVNMGSNFQRNLVGLVFGVTSHLTMNGAEDIIEPNR